MSICGFLIQGDYEVSVYIEFDCSIQKVDSFGTVFVSEFNGGMN